jgi:hypothetical protein
MSPDDSLDSGSSEMKKPIASLAIGVCLLALSAGAVLAANPHSPGTTGQPNQSCQSFSATTRPGNSGTSLGAPFNEPGINSTSGGTGGNAYNAAGAPSEYDVACFQQSQMP